MKTLLAVLSVVLLCTGCDKINDQFAQDGENSASVEVDGKKDKNDNSEKKLIRLTKELGLSPEQATSIQAIQARDGGKKEIMATLTPEQVALWKRSRAQRAADKSKETPIDPIATMQQNLGLSDEQVAEMRAIKEADGSREDLRAVLTPEQLDMMKALKKERNAAAAAAKDAEVEAGVEAETSGSADNLNVTGEG